MAQKIGIGLAVLALIGGCVAAVIIDKNKCEALHGKYEVSKAEFEPHSGEYEIRLNVVLERAAKLKSWKAKYAGKVFASSDEEGKEMLVRQTGDESSRAGFLGSDVKRIYGADYKKRSYKFFVRRLEKAPAKMIELSGVIGDPVKGEIPFKEVVELR